MQTDDVIGERERQRETVIDKERDRDRETETETVGLTEPLRENAQRYRNRDRKSETHTDSDREEEIRGYWDGTVAVKYQQRSLVGIGQINCAT